MEEHVIEGKQVSGTVQYSTDSTQTILTILWHFVHQSTEAQCSQYTKISDKKHSSIVKWYKFARTVCTEWINNPDNMPK